MSQTIEIPDILNNRDEDYVWYSYNKKDVKEKNQTNQACYYECMSSLPECNFTLKPSNDKSLLPFNIFSKYIKLCQDNGIVNKDASVSGSEGNNQLIIPSGQNKHKVYASLCCYRWSENQPGMAYATVQAFEKYPEIDFFQAFHYGCGRRVYWPLHSFHNIVHAKSKYSPGVDSMLYVPNSIFIAHFFRNCPTTKSPLVDKEPNAGLTASAIDRIKISNGFNGQTSADSSKYKIKNLEDILSPKLTKLYREPINTGIVEKIISEM